MDIKFESIDIEVNFFHCLEFRRDSYFCSFGTYTGYEDSIVGYEKRMRKRIDESNWYYFHIWCGSEIIGQLEFRTFSDLPETGYVHLIYIVSKYRGLGVAKLAQSFIINTLITNNCKNAMLSVSRTNKRAIKHYKRFGWKYLKPNPKHEAMDFYVSQLSI
ncbi:GNAT family N-acetyltransferase [Psychromonas sp. Urea-02u-13]|uniref:GNAT family N-acetyltransferase n=1 Tax=Psychromonas sp. Urea-02u-13 TaxID=2058326 RepID=UPI000C34B2A9|nr:GNAT family N-acetyltransferase [Psychromonas sp. Urea-02u-13]PKG39809.1 N-acetyltransferase [Psychromonas sp. Urea-02u-13]